MDNELKHTFGITKIFHNISEELKTEIEKLPEKRIFTLNIGEYTLSLKPIEQ